MRKSDKTDTEKRLAKVLEGVINAKKNRYFAMTLSAFDVSPQSADPIILIPLRARNEDEKFWYWPELFIKRDDYSDLYVDATVTVDKIESSQRLRIYEYKRKSEFRLQCKEIKRKGDPGDILLVDRYQDEFKCFLIRRSITGFHNLSELLNVKVSALKQYGYFDKIPESL